MAERHETNRFLGGFTQFFVPFFASRQSLCTWHRYFEKKSVLACFFWSQEALIQNSAALQGSPPPTQQMKIKMQISWVGRSTNEDGDHLLAATCSVVTRLHWGSWSRSPDHDCYQHSYWSSSIIGLIFCQVMQFPCTERQRWYDQSRHLSWMFHLYWLVK